MNVLTQRRCLTGLAGGLLLGACGAGAWALSGLPQPQPTSPLKVPSAIASQNHEIAASDTSFDSGLLAMSLRSPLEDPPPVQPRREPPPRVTPPPKPVPPPTLNLTLLATIIDPQKSLAVIADASSTSDSKGVGEQLALSPEGITIVSIESGQVTVAHNGKESTLVVAKKKRPGGGQPNNNPNRARNR